MEIGWATAFGKRVVLPLDDTPAMPYSHLVSGLVETGRARWVSLAAWEVELSGTLRRPTPALSAPTMG